MTGVGRALFLLFAVAGAIPAQLYVFNTLLPGSWAPHLGVLLVILATQVWGDGFGVVVGLVLGLLYDRFTVGEVGLHLLLLPLVAAAIGLVRWLVPEMTLGNRMGVIFGIVLVVEVVGAVLHHLAGSILLDSWMLLHHMLPAIIANTLWGVTFLAVAQWVQGVRGYR
ncbi:MAG: rod shape-determining protein MreD [Leptospirillia bacterium]